MDPNNSQNSKSPFKFTGERVALMLGGTLIGALAIVFSLKLATPIVKKACKSLLEAPDKGERDVRIASVEAVALKPGTISKRITTIGKLRANEYVTIHSEMQGRIKEIAFKEGTMVKKGDTLIRFEDDELQAELAKAEADVEYRQVKFDRMQKPEFKGHVREHEYDQERGNLNIAKAAVELAKAKLAKATITAPFDGKIGLINVSVGAFIDTQKELVTIVDFDPMKIDFKIPEIHIHDIGVGQTAEVKVDSFPDQVFQATVEAIDSRVDPQTHSIAVRATIPNEDGKLQTGLFGSVGVIIGVKNDALIVPESALGREGDIEYVWVAVNGKAGRKRVLTGTKENGQVEITAGLREGEIVVTSGQLKLGEGTAVKISNMGGGDVEVTDEEIGATSAKDSSPKNGSKTLAAQPTPQSSEPGKDTKPEPTASKPESSLIETKPETPIVSAQQVEQSATKAELAKTPGEPSKSEELSKNVNIEPTKSPEQLAPTSPLTGQTAVKEHKTSETPPPNVVTAEKKPETSTPAVHEGNPTSFPSNNGGAIPSGSPNSADKIKNESASAVQTPPTTELQAKESEKPATDSSNTSSQNIEKKAAINKFELKPKVDISQNIIASSDKESYFSSIFTKARDFAVNLFKRN